jgi:hypothetical protein
MGGDCFDKFAKVLGVAKSFPQYDKQCFPADVDHGYRCVLQRSFENVAVGDANVGIIRRQRWKNAERKKWLECEQQLIIGGLLDIYDAPVALECWPSEGNDCVPERRIFLHFNFDTSVNGMHLGHARPNHRQRRPGPRTHPAQWPFPAASHCVHPIKPPSPNAGCGIEMILSKIQDTKENPSVLRRN